MVARRSATTTSTPVGSPQRRWSIPFCIWFPLAIFAATRLVNFIMISLAARHQVALYQTIPGYYVNTPMPASPSYLSVVTNWDGQWYERIATHGYGEPSALSYGDAIAEGHAWAFPPLFPLAAAGVMELTGVGFGAAATVVNLIAGAAAMVMIFLLLERTAGRFVASALVAMTCAFISAPLLQLAYSESLALAFLSAALLLIQRRRYGFAMIAVTALALTRLITPPLAVVIVAHSWSRYRRRAEAPVRRTEILGMLGVGLLSLGGLSLWSFIATSWLSASEGTDANRGSVSGLAGMSFGWFGALYRAQGLAGTGLLLVAVLVLVRLAYDSRANNWGTEIRAWYWAYPTFILAGSGVHAGILRYLLLAFPLLLTVVGSPGRETIPRLRLALVVVLCCVGLGLQWFWIDHALIMHQARITPWMP
jgi:hypothetical protein